MTSSVRTQEAGPLPATGGPGTADEPARTPRGRRRGYSLATQVLCVASVLALWQALVAFGVLSADAVARPTEIVRALSSQVLNPAFWASVGATVRTWGIGLAISLVLALPAGLVLGASDLTYRMFRVTIDVLRTIPPVALLPLALLLYGATERMALLLIVVGSVWPVVLQTMYGVHSVDPLTRDVARSYRLRRRDVVLAVTLPSAAPYIATGIRIAATTSLLLAVGAGILGGAPGIGASITAAQLVPDIPRLWAFVVVAAALGVVLNLLVVGLERRLLSWHSSHRDRH